MTGIESAACGIEELELSEAAGKLAQELDEESLAEAEVGGAELEATAEEG